jgi:hypothetical protein
MMCHIGQDICSITRACTADTPSGLKARDGLARELLHRGATEALRVDLEAARSEAETMRCKAENAEEDCCAGLM